MSNTAVACGCEEFVETVRRQAVARVRWSGRVLRGEEAVDLVLPGKMLRTRLAGRMAARGVASPDLALIAVCAATEMAHTASLCHDDVIDGASVRRARPTLWRITGPSAAVLVGDLLLCEALSLLLETGDGRHPESFVSKLREVCLAEAEQEMSVRGRRLDADACVDIARRKTGPLFALVAGACGGDDPGLCRALDEAGYRLGAAYQLADDWIDVFGDERTAGKTLGTDQRRAKFTLAQAPDRPEALHARIEEMLHSVVACLDPWPDARDAAADFMQMDLYPVLRRQDERLGLDVRAAI